ncbi:MAG: SdrD B-like domain-containing protein, partial [Verrucomicrobiota bacterium]
VQNSGPNPLVYNLGTMAPNAMKTIRTYVTCTSTGILLNTVTATSNGSPLATAYETVLVGLQSALSEVKTVTPSSTTPGSTVQYTITVSNNGTAANGSPLVINDFLPSGFTYASLASAKLNGGTPASGVVSVNSSNTSQPVFTISQGINVGSTLVLVFNATVGAGVTTGTYTNQVNMIYESKTVSGIPEAPVTVGGGSIGDTIFRDWNGNGVQDAGEEGMAGVTVTLSGAASKTAITDANGNYLFSGLVAGNYTVTVPTAGNGGVPTGFTITSIPPGAAGSTTSTAITLATNQAQLTSDWGYKPGGTGVIGDQVYKDLTGDGTFSGSDTGIANVTVKLYQDDNGNGVIDSSDALIGTTATNSSGIYSFTGLATGFSYIVAADTADTDLINAFSPNSFTTTTPVLRSVVNLAGTDNTADFGYRASLPSSIGDTVFYDINGNGVYDAGTDIPLPNITVSLYRDSNGDGLADGAAIATASTDASGQYLFSNLAPDTYLVVVDTADPNLPGGMGTTVTQYDVPLPVSTAYLTADFPFTKFVNKTVDKSYAITGNTLNYSITPTYPVNQQLANVRVFDPLPTGTTYTASSANAGGTYGAYTPVAAVPGTSGTGVTGDPTLTTSLATSASFVNVGSNVTVTLTLKSTPDSFTGVVPANFTVDGGAYTIISGPTPASQSVPGTNAAVTYTWVLRLDAADEYTFSADAVDSTGNTTWPTGRSSTVLAAYGGSNVVTWNLGSNVVGTPNQTILIGTPAGIYGSQGGTSTFSRYGIAAGTWATRSAYGGGTVVWGALAADGVQTIYGLRGNNTPTFYSYDSTTNGWTALTNCNANAGGSGPGAGGAALVYLNLSGTKYVYAVMGGNTATFSQYSVSGSSWAAKAVVPANVGVGGALTTDGTYIYALIGNNKASFYRYDPVANTWTARANLPANVKGGGALTYLGGYVYAFNGNAKNTFYRYNGNTLNTWTKMANAPGSIGNGGALANDGTSIYALAGNKTNAFYRYTVSTNAWSTRANYYNNLAVTTGADLRCDRQQQSSECDR